MKPTPSRKTPAPKDPQQIKAFRKAARELGADENEERFRDALRTVGKAKPSAEKVGDIEHSDNRRDHRRQK